MNKIGKIYKIKNKLNGKSYIGQTWSDVGHRVAQHRYSQNKSIIGSALKKYGNENFDISILAESDNQDVLNWLEFQFIEKENSYSPNGYNIKTGGLNSGPLPEETKRKIGEKSAQRKHTEATKALLREKRLQRPPASCETNLKISKALTGRKKSPEHSERIRQAKLESNPMKGRQRTPEEKAKISEGMKKYLEKKMGSSPDPTN